MIVAFVGVVESMSHVKQSVTVHCFAVTNAVDGATKPALHASTASVKRNVVSLANLVTKNASGSASIMNARNCVGSCATAQDATCHVQSYFGAGIPVSVSVGKYARRSVESVTGRR